MKPRNTPSLLTPACRIIVAIVTLLLVGHSARAQIQVYSENFDVDSSANWVTNTTGSGFSYADFYFDYSLVGVPSAPNSSGTTRGLKLGANLGTGGSFPAGISVSPLNFGISQNFELRFDMWLNYNKSGVGSTEVGGAGYGTAGTSAQVAGSVDSVFIGATTDGGSSADYRVYGPNYAGSYQDADHVTGGDPTSPLVYAAGSRNNTATYYVTNFPSTPVPEAQTNLFPRQTGTVAPAGTLAFSWHDVSLKKVGTVITYRVDGVVIGTVDSNDAGTPAGTNILFNFFDINTGGSTDIDATNILFALFDNVRITTLTNIVNVTASQPNASEEGPTSGTFTITRSTADGPLTVYYTMGGTATPGSDYVALPGSVDFGPTDTSVNVTVTPIDDSVSELPETVLLTITDNPSYSGAGTAKINIADNDTPTLNISVIQPSMYEAYTNDFIKYHIQRLGNLNVSDFEVNLTYGGTASGSDFVGPATVTMPSGLDGTDFSITPVNNSAVSGPKTVIATIASGGSYALGTTLSATGTIVDDESPAAPMLLDNPLTSSADAANWGITYGTGNPADLSGNYNVDFGFNLASAYGAPVPPPPSGAATALHITCNKSFNPGAAGAVNVYYTNQAFSGNYAVRFKMCLIEGQDLGFGSEGAVFGINHSGSLSNWWFGSGPTTNITWGSDGVWYYMTAQASGDSIGDYHEYTGIGGTNNNTGWQRLSTKTASAYTNAFKNNPGPFTSVSGTGFQLSGLPANAPPIAYDGANWADVEIKQLGSIVTMSINKNIIFTYTNTTVWKSGYLMLGYADPYGGTDGSSIGAPDAGVYFSDLKVVSLTAPSITTSVLNGNSLTLSFTAADGGSPATSFVVESATVVSGPYSAVSPAPTITSLGNGTFQAVVTQNGPTRYYRVRNN